MWREFEAAVGVHVRRKKEGEQHLMVLQNKMVEHAVKIRAGKAQAAERDARHTARSGVSWRRPCDYQKKRASAVALEPAARTIFPIFAEITFSVLGT